MLWIDRNHEPYCEQTVPYELLWRLWRGRVALWGLFPHRFFALVGVIFIRRFHSRFLCRCHACLFLTQCPAGFTISSLNFPAHLLGRAARAPTLVLYTLTCFGSTRGKARYESGFTGKGRSWQGNACPRMVNEEPVTGGGVQEEEGSKLMICACSARGYSTKRYEYIIGPDATR